MKNIMTTSNKLLLGLLLTILLFATVLLGIGKYYGMNASFDAIEEQHYVEPPAPPTPPAPPAPVE